MEQRLSCLTLGVRDLARSVAFYRSLGWEPREDEHDDVFFFQAGGMVVALWSRESLAQDSCVPDGKGWGGVFLDPDGHPWGIAHNPFWPLQEDGEVRLG